MPLRGGSWAAGAVGRAGWNCAAYQAAPAMIGSFSVNKQTVSACGAPAQRRRPTGRCSFGDAMQLTAPQQRAQACVSNGRSRRRLAVRRHVLATPAPASAAASNIEALKACSLISAIKTPYLVRACISPAMSSSCAGPTRAPGRAQRPATDHGRRLPPPTRAGAVPAAPAARRRTASST